MVERKNTRGRRNDSSDRRRREVEVPKVEWVPKTELGKLVKEGKITDIEEIFNKGLRIMEPEIINVLLPDLEEDLLLIGQAKGKFGGGQRRVFRQTQKKTKEGNRIHFTTCAVVGNKNGLVGLAFGKSKETVPARDKAKSKARLNLIKIRRGCGSWETDSRESNSIPFTVEGKCGSVKIKLMPAPRGTGLCIEKECAKILALAGIKDIRSKTKGQTKTKINMIKALINALNKLIEVKIKPEDVAKLGIVEGRMKGSEDLGKIKEDMEEVSPPVEEESDVVESVEAVEETSEELSQDVAEEPVTESEESVEEVSEKYVEAVNEV